MLKILAWIPDFTSETFFVGLIAIEGQRIISIEKTGSDEKERLNANSIPYVLPGFVDAHIHIESSMLVPSRFAEMAVNHGTIATVSDPHEIGNVLGDEGVSYMVRNGDSVPMKFGFNAPSCVPATDFEQSGAILSDKDLEKLIQREKLIALGEMMNFPGVIYDDPEVWKKIRLAKKLGIPIDGHAPGLTGEMLKKYIGAGILTDHEAVSIVEAEEKLNLGMHILIREGSAAKNFDSLATLISKYPEQVMLCSDDLHPDDLKKGHINKLVKRALDMGISIFDLMKVSSLNPISFYKLNVGKLEVGDPADFIVVNNLDQLEILETYIDGEPVYTDGKVSFTSKEEATPNTFIEAEFRSSDFHFHGQSGIYRIIVAEDGSLITKQDEGFIVAENGLLQTDTVKDILKIAVVNRYQYSKPSVAWVRNFGLKHGAIASSVAHDSHNIVVVGVDDDSISRAVNSLIRSKGGIIAVNGDNEYLLPLPVAGLMSINTAEEVASAYEKISNKAKEMACELQSPFMTLSFMALLVIPELKIGDRGLFDVKQFKFVEPKL